MSGPPFVRVIGPDGKILFQGYAELNVEQKMAPVESFGSPSIYVSGPTEVTINLKSDYYQTTHYVKYEQSEPHKPKSEKVKLTPIAPYPMPVPGPPVPPERLAEILEAAADKLLVDGWTKGAEHKPKAYAIDGPYVDPYGVVPLVPVKPLGKGLTYGIGYVDETMTMEQKELINKYNQIKETTTKSAPTIYWDGSDNLTSPADLINHYQDKLKEEFDKNKKKGKK